MLTSSPARQHHELRGHHTYQHLSKMPSPQLPSPQLQVLPLTPAQPQYQQRRQNAIEMHQHQHHHQHLQQQNRPKQTNTTEHQINQPQPQSWPTTQQQPTIPSSSELVCLNRPCHGLATPSAGVAATPENSARLVEDLWNCTGGWWRHYYAPGTQQRQPDGERAHRKHLCTPQHRLFRHLHDAAGMLP